MFNDVLEQTYRLTQAGEPFVLATVVWREQPTSAQIGSQAIIRSDGQLSGWIGGSCAQPIVVRESQRVLREGGGPFLLRLGSPEAGPMRKDVRIFPMTCSSGGVLDIYMEPHLPQPQLILIGDSPVIAALSKLAAVLHFAIVQLSAADLSHLTLNEQTSILVATHGQYDEDALEQALRSPACYVGMVGSHRRGDAVRAYLRGSGLTEEQLARLNVPAGLDIGAAAPEEIAASILAELVQVRRRGEVRVPAVELWQAEERQQPKPIQEIMASAVPESALDPVCGMIVETATARHHSTYEGREIYFCCPACKRLFERNPQEYLVEQRER